MNLKNELSTILRLIAENPSEAADKLEAMAAKLLHLSGVLRSQSPMRSEPGMAERVQMRVVGPDGTVKKNVDTQEN